MSIKVRALDSLVGDNSNAVTEYFKLKSRLTLTEEERYNALERNDTRSHYILCRNDNKIFKSLAECVKHYNVRFATVYKAIKAGRPLRNGLIFEKLERVTDE